MKTPPQYSHLCSRTFSCDVRLGCCRAYLLLHLSEQKTRRRPCPLRAGMALPQFGHRPITLMLPIRASSIISHLDMYWFRCQGQHFDNFPHLIPLSAIIKPANSQSKHCRRFSNKILSSAFCSDLWYNDKHRTLLSPSFTN